MSGPFEDPHGALNRRATDPAIEMLAHRFGRMESAIEKLTEVVSRMAVVEEKQSTDRAALERAFMAIQKTDERCSLMFERTAEKLEKIDARVDALEHIAPSSIQTNEWVSRVMWAAAALGCTLLLGKLGFLMS